MPELPEVENLVCGVREIALGSRFTAIDFYRDDVREEIPKQELCDVLIDETVTAVTRRAKYMLIHTKRGALGIHLGMSGRFVHDQSTQVSRPHTHVVFKLKSADGDFSFHFVDPRRFGRVFALSETQAETLQHQFLDSLGVEPLAADVDLAKVFFDKSRTRKVPLKNFVMDNAIVVGVGNIYASESLWRAKLSPYREASSLTRTEARRLALEIKKTLAEAIAAGGTTFRDYRNSHDKPGMFQVKLAVYEQEAKPCRRCHKIIHKTVVGSRSTYFCPFCQK